MATQGCPCGHLGDPRHGCECPPATVERYRSRISGPLLDRIDLHVEVPAPTLCELKAGPGEATSAIRERVLHARERQATRFQLDPGETQAPKGHGAADHRCNAALRPDELDGRVLLAPEARALLDRAYDRLGLSARALSRILKVARTIADLDDAGDVEKRHVAEAVQYRSLDRRCG